MDEVHTLRNNYCADVCVLLAYDPSICGIAANIGGGQSDAFCLVSTYSTCVTTNYSFGHEIGHLLGCRVVINFNAVFLDGGGITIGNHTLIGPNCQLLTPDHPHDYMERRKTIETGLPVRIGDDCWLGGGVTVCPGVTIGNRVIVGAGSVVTHDIPDDVVVAGNPAKIIKTNGKV